MSATLMEALLDEIERNGRILGHYDNIGPACRFAIMMTEADLKEAKKAIMDNDLAAMIVALEKLKANAE